MIKKMLAVLYVITVSYGLYAQAFTKLPEDARLNNVSANGEWAFTTHQNAGVVLYDIANKNLTRFEGADYYADAISNDGVLAGTFKKIPAVYKDGEWIELPIPAGVVSTTGSSARGISANGKIVCGHVGTAQRRKPTIWTLQDDGSYLPEILPCPEKDPSGRTLQAVDALSCSAEGDVICGRLIDYSGLINMPMYWKKNNQNVWESVLLGKDLIFKEGVEIPVLPEYPNEPNPMSYFIAADSATYKQAVDDYKATPIGEDPAWNPERYITHPDSIAAYDKAVEEYTTLNEAVDAEVQAFYKLLTGKSFDAYSLRISGNGQYITSACTYKFRNSNHEVISIFSPMYIDLNTGKMEVLDDVPNGLPNGMTDEGDFFYATPYSGSTRSAFVLPAGSKTPVEFTQWVKQKSKGVLDIKPELQFTFTYIDPVTEEPVTAEDSLMTGDVHPSANGKIIIGSLIPPGDKEYFTYIVDLNSTQSVKDIPGDKDNIVVYPNPATDVLYIKGNAEKISVADLAGRTVYQSSSVPGSIPVSSFGKGTYLVEVTTNGKTTTHKVIVTN